MSDRPISRGFAPAPRHDERRSPPIAVVFAGVVAVCGGLYGLLGAWAALTGLRTARQMRSSFPERDWDHVQLDRQFDLAVGAVLAVLLGLGGVLFLARRTVGLTMVIIGSGLAVFGSLGAAATMSMTSALVIVVMFALPAAGVLIMTLMPVTRRWVDAGGHGRSGLAPYN